MFRTNNLSPVPYATCPFIVASSIQYPLTKAEGVVDENFKVHGYDNFYILDGSIMPCNLGVNPSFTITALSEYAMSKIEAKAGNKNVSLEEQMANQKS